MKINSDKDLDELFHDKLAEEKLTPSNKLWNNIEAELDKDKRKPAAYWWFGIGAALLLLLSGTYYFLRTDENKISDQKNISAIENTSNNNSTADQQTKNNSIDKIPNSSSSENTTIKNENDGSLKNDVEKKENTNITQTSDNSTKHHVSISSHTQRIEMKDASADPVPEKHTSLPNDPGRIEMKKGGPDSEKKIDNSQSTVDNKKDSEQHSTSTQKDTTLPLVDDKEKNNETGNGNISMNKKTTGVSDPDHEPSTQNDSPPLNKKEDQPVVPLVKKDSVIDTTKTIAKKPDSTKTIAHNSPPVIKPDSSPVKKDRVRKFYVAGFYSYDVLHSTGANNKWDVDDANSATTCFARTSQAAEGKYSVGIKLGYFISKRFAIDAEVNHSYIQNTSNEFLMSYWKYANPVPDFNVYSSYGSVKILGSNFTPDDNSRPWYYFGDSCWIRGKVSEKYQFVNIPISVRGNLIDLKWLNIYARVGASVNYIYSQQLDFTVSKSQNVIGFKKVNDLNPLNFGFAFGLGTEFKLSSAIGIWVEPGWRYTATSPSKNAKDHPNTLTVPFGLIFHF